MEAEIKLLAKEIQTIKERNKKVETEKAWETSKIRMLAITVLTYLSMLILMKVLEIDQPNKNAFIASIGFVISTISLPFVKRWWLKLYKS